MTLILTKRDLRRAFFVTLAAAVALALKAWFSASRPSFAAKEPTVDRQSIARLIVRAGAALAILAALWLILSPWLLPGAYPTRAIWNDMIVGLILIALMAFKTLVTDLHWPEWVGIFLGLWLLFSPWGLVHAGNPIALRNETITSTAIILACAITAFSTMYRLGAPKLLT